jgi:DNA-binding MarR family transcriptional regulator
MNRKAQIERLLEDLGSLRHSMTFRGAATAKAPRITPAQWGVILLIHKCAGTSVKDVAEALRISSSAATQLVDGLVRSGYVVRKERAKDRRTRSLTLSARTRGHVEKMRKEVLAQFQKVFTVLNDAELEQYAALTKKISEHYTT